MCLNILLPEYIDPISTKYVARKLLKDLGSYAKLDRDGKMQRTFEELWKRSGMGIEEMYEKRVSLFRIVLCSFRPLAFSALTQALRISFNEEHQYEDDLEENTVRRLGANFLVAKGNGPVEFAHGSAKAFVESGHLR